MLALAWTDRSAIFFQSDEERQVVAAAIERESERLGKPVETTLEELGTFTPAEDHHQGKLVKAGQSATKGDTTPIRIYG